MEWQDAELGLPNENKLVLIKTRREAWSEYVTAYWSVQDDCFFDYNKNYYTASHWMYIPAMKEKGDIPL